MLNNKFAIDRPACTRYINIVGRMLIFTLLPDLDNSIFLFLNFDLDADALDNQSVSLEMGNSRFLRPLNGLYFFYKKLDSSPCGELSHAR